MISVYEWKDLIEEDEEALLIIKSHVGKSKALTEFIETNHPYDCPEVLTVKVSLTQNPSMSIIETIRLIVSYYRAQVHSGSNKYLNWVQDVMSKPRLESTNLSSGENK